MWSSCWQPNSANTPCSRARSLPRATFQHEAPIHLGGRFACASAVYAGAHPDSQRIKNPASCTILSPMLRFLNHRPPSKSFPLSTLLRLPRSEEHGFQEGGTTGNRTQHWGKNRAERVAFALEDELAEIGRAPSCKSRLDNIALANKNSVPPQAQRNPRAVRQHWHRRSFQTTQNTERPREPRPRATRSTGHAS